MSFESSLWRTAAYWFHLTSVNPLSIVPSVVLLESWAPFWLVVQALLLFVIPWTSFLLFSESAPASHNHPHLQVSRYGHFQLSLSCLFYDCICCLDFALYMPFNLSRPEFALSRGRTDMVGFQKPQKHMIRCSSPLNWDTACHVRCSAFFVCIEGLQWGRIQLSSHSEGTKPMRLQKQRLNKVHLLWDRQQNHSWQKANREMSERLISERMVSLREKLKIESVLSPMALLCCFVHPFDTSASSWLEKEGPFWRNWWTGTAQGH